MRHLSRGPGRGRRDRRDAVGGGGIQQAGDGHSHGRQAEAELPDPVAWKANTVTLLLIGAITFYAQPYVGGPLRCGSVNGASPIYDTTHEWIAVDLDAYPEWRCNDLVRVTVGDYEKPIRVKDSGPLSLYNIGGVPIVADLPQHVFMWPGLSVQGTVENVTAGLRLELEAVR